MLHSLLSPLLTRHVGQVHHHVGVLGVRQVDGPPGVHQRLQVGVAVRDDGGALAPHHAHVAHKLSVQLDLTEDDFVLQIW